MTKKQLNAAELSFCSKFESVVESVRIMNIIGDSLTAKGLAEKKRAEEWVNKYSDKYLTITGR